ncbi:MAG: TetR/AcrR family transcriptional regulator [Gemmatimonadota bacterium]
MKTNESYHHGDLRRALLEAAGAILQESGAPALSLRGIARRAGVSHMAPYHHFAGRGELVAALAADGFERLAAAMRDAMESAAGADPVERLRACGVAYVVFAVRNPEMFHLMFGRELADSSAHPELRQAARVAYRTFAAALPTPAAEAAGRAPADDGDPESRESENEIALPPIALAAWSLVHGLAMLVAEGQVGSGAAGPEEAERLTREAMSALRLFGRGREA